MPINRRHVLALALAAPAISRGRAAENANVRVGFQKGEPILMAARANRTLEALLEPKGYGVEWLEFQFGPPMLEAMRVGSVDVGAVGDTPPVFAQAAHGDLVYIAANRGAPQSVLLPPNSRIETLADLKAKKLAFGRGSAAHNFTLMVLEKAGLDYSDIQPVYLGPADAGAAFRSGAVDAWCIWEPYTSLNVTRPGVRTLTTSKEIGEQFGYIMGRGPFVRAEPGLAATIVEAFAATAEQARGHKQEVAALLAGATGIPQDVWALALVNHPFQVMPMNDDLVRSQQRVADRFHAEGLVPSEIKVSDIVWRAGV